MIHHVTAIRLSSLRKVALAMLIRRAGRSSLVLLASSFLSLPAAVMAATPSFPDPPAPLIPYIVNGNFDPGDYGWLRGAFSGATPQQVADYEAIRSWQRDCFQAGLVATRAGLKDIGVEANAALDRMPYAILLCGQVATLPERLDKNDWEGFSHDVEIARPTIDGFLNAVRLSRKIDLSNADERGPALIARALDEQTLRYGGAWLADPSAFDGMTGKLTARQRAIVGAAISIERQRKDHDNIAWFKSEIGKRGWPRPSEVGRTAAKMAWLLVQHADMDPVFQLRILRLMAPLVSKGEVAGADYAFLTDRVLLKTTGRQRYGTQLACMHGKLEPLPLERAGEVEGRRRSVGLNDLYAYRAETQKAVGGCGP